MSFLQEYDHPYTLLQNRNGYFYRLVEETGPAMADQLLKVAEEVRLLHLSMIMFLDAQL
jgi:ATP-binding cassette subfamily C (CFTR/MRP) protein 4